MVKTIFTPERIQFLNTRRLCLLDSWTGPNRQNDHFARNFYHTIRESGIETAYITKEAYKLKLRGIKKGITEDHFNRPQLYSEIVSFNPQYLEDLDMFLELATHLQTVCICTNRQNNDAKETKLSKTAPRTRTRYLYQSLGFEVYAYPLPEGRKKRSIKDVIVKPTQFEIPDEMDDFEREVLGWVRR
jgi:hypothetical protein